ncbi:hypothetical protein [Thermocatellispora tengchongensis]|uniref:hypothetical protein n=1 Tax=Thermocatellispora tengchongensis TaxID=1073253 RepID=UPI003638E9D7
MPVLHVIDAPEPRQEADLYLDQNLGAEARYDPGTPVLAGARYALLRDDVVREGGEVRPDAAAPPRVLCFFGGTDAAGVTGRWLRALADTGVPCVCTAVGDAPAYPGMTVIPPTDELPALMARADLVLTAAGSATWELLYLGVPAALTWVAANQLVGYEAVVGNGLATGLGADPEAAVPVLRALLAELAAPGARARLGGPGRALIDGHGRSRVADALLALSRSSSRSAASPWACHG